MGRKREQTTDETAFASYLKEQEAAKHTIDSCLAAHRLFFQLYSEITPENLQGFKEYLIQNYKASTVNTRIYGINRFLAYYQDTDGHCGTLVRNDIRESGFRLNIIQKQNLPFLDNIISREDYEKLRDGLRRDRDMIWYFAVRFLACTGARISELIQIKREHICLGYMDLYTKGGKIRRIYLPKGLCREANQWMEKTQIGSGFLFRNRRGEAVSSRWISSQLKKRAAQYGIPEETVYPHSFRHRFAKNFLEKCSDIALLADLMGHESIETTRIYLTKSSHEQREIIDKVVTW